MCDVAYHWPDKGKYSIKERSWNIDEGPTWSLQLRSMATMRCFIIFGCNWAVGEREALRAACKNQKLHSCFNRGPPMMPHGLKLRIVGNILSQSCINWTSFILQMLLNPSLQGQIAVLCLDSAPPTWRLYCSTNMIKFGQWVEQAKFWFQLHFLRIYGNQKGFIHFMQKQRNCLGWNRWWQNCLWKKIVTQADFVTFYFMEMRSHFCTYPLSHGCWLSLILRCTPDSCNFSLSPTSDALTSGHSQ